MADPGARSEGDPTPPRMGLMGPTAADGLRSDPDWAWRAFEVSYWCSAEMWRRQASERRRLALRELEWLDVESRMDVGSDVPGGGAA